MQNASDKVQVRIGLSVSKLFMLAGELFTGLLCYRAGSDIIEQDVFVVTGTHVVWFSTGTVIKGHI